MPEGPGVVANDPFWSVVRRRHPDLDIVILPPARTVRPEIPERTPLRDPAEVAEACTGEVHSLWLALLGGREPTAADERWLPGADRRTARRESTWSHVGLDPTRAREVLAEAIGTLRTQGWQVFVPPRGIPRVMAARDAEIGRQELQLLHVESRERVVLRVVSADFLLGEGAARDVVLGGDA